jgi:hypothetical protein
LLTTVVGEVEAIVEVGVVLAGVVEEADEFEEELDPPVEATVALPVAADEATVEAVEAVLPDEEELDELVLAGFELSCGTPAAKGLRAIRASSTLAGTSLGCLAGVVDVWLVVAAVEVVAAAGGAGRTGALVAEALLSRNTGTAITATTSAATTIHSLRSSRSRRSELILGLRRSKADTERR